jgi:hypothetical protein
MQHANAVILLLCLSITCQMLGAPISFFHLAEPLDLVESSIQEGFSIVTYFAGGNPLSRCSLANLRIDPVYHFSSWSDFFHPPLAILR